MITKKQWAAKTHSDTTRDGIHDAYFLRYVGCQKPEEEKPEWPVDYSDEKQGYAVAVHYLGWGTDYELAFFELADGQFWASTGNAEEMTDDENRIVDFLWRAVASDLEAVPDSLSVDLLCGKQIDADAVRAQCRDLESLIDGENDELGKMLSGVLKTLRLVLNQIEGPEQGNAT